MLQRMLRDERFLADPALAYRPHTADVALLCLYDRLPWCRLPCGGQRSTRIACLASAEACSPHPFRAHETLKPEPGGRILVFIGVSQDHCTALV